MGDIMQGQGQTAFQPLNREIAGIKPDFSEAAARWEAYWNRDVLDRPVLTAVLLKPGTPVPSPVTYRDRVYGNLDDILQNQLENLSSYVFLGDSMPSFWMSLGTHEIASYCGYDVQWGEGTDTNWCRHTDIPLAELLPIAVDKEGFWWKRAVLLLQKIRTTFHGRILPFSFDFHTNLDLLLSIRGDANLCLDTIDCPEVIDRALEYTNLVFQELWELFVRESGCMAYGFYFDGYSEKPTTSLACDFSALISREMFRRWGVPALEFEAGLVGERTIYHWDGPAALKHMDALCGIHNIHTFRYVPSPNTYHYQFLELYQECQKRGKSIGYAGTPEEIKAAHKVLHPAMTTYAAQVQSMEEFEDLSRWLVQHT